MGKSLLQSELPNDPIVDLHERYTLLSESISGVLYDFDVERGSTIRSNGLFGLLGFRADEVSSLVDWWNDRIHPEDQERVREAFQNAQTHCEVEYRIQHRDGNFIHIWDRALILRDQNGTIKRIVGNNIDISRHKEVERFLETSYEIERSAREAAEARERYLVRLLRISNAFSMALNSDQIAEIVLGELFLGAQANRVMLYRFSSESQTLSCLRFRGYTEEVSKELENIPISANFPFCEALRATPAEIDCELVCNIDDYPEYAAIVGRSWKGKVLSLPLMIGGRVLGIIVMEFRFPFQVSEDERNFFRIITLACAQAFERARLFESELHAREEAEAASRAKDEFFAIVSHELRSPLQSILGWIRLARTAKLDANASARALEVMEHNTRSQVQLVSDMLEASRIITGKISMSPEPTSVGLLVESSIDLIRPTATIKGVNLHYQVQERLPLISGDANRLQQVFWNLLSNAIKFTPKGGEITVSLRSIPGYIELVVKDTGEGIVPEFIPMMFERFAQSDKSKVRVHGGLGLGLAIARHIVELHGGEISAESAGLGLGTELKVLLPVCDSIQMDSLKNKIALRQHRSLERIKVLIVEDAADTREFLMAALQSSGAETMCTSTAAAAIELVKIFKPDILLSDIGLPDVDGYSLVQELRKSLTPSDLPTLALTAFASKEDAQRTLDSGFQLHLSKPVDPDELIRAIAGLLPFNVTRPIP